MKKSLFAFLIILLLAISLVGCKNKKTTNTTITTNEASSTTVNKYTVKWMNGEKLLLEESYNEGDIPNYKGTIPTKASTGRYEYTFDGWVGTIAPVTSDTSYYAHFKETVRKYTVTWVLLGGYVSEEYEYGETPSYPFGIPQVSPTEQYTYQFVEWGEEIVPVTEDTFYHARFNEYVRKYTVKFIVDKYETTTTFDYGSMPVYVGKTPTKNGDDQYSYTFIGWDKEFTAVKADVTYTALFEQTVNKYLVKFVNEDDTVLYQEEFEYGVIPTYTGTTPTKESTNTLNYTFSGWDKEPVAVTGDATYKAAYTSSTRLYTIRWVDGHTIYREDHLEYGEMPVFEATPTREPTIDTVYTFYKWNKEIQSVTCDTDYSAVWIVNNRKYTIKFINYDETVLESKEVKYGVVPTYTGATPTRTNTAQYSYAFDRWDNAIVAVTGDATYKATFTSTVNTYIVVWKLIDGAILETDLDVPYGTVPTYDGETPEKAADNTYTYEFAGWSPEVVAVTGDVTYTATFTQTYIEYNVKFMSEGNIISDVNYHYGDTVEVPANPIKDSTAQYTYTFTGWSPEVVAVTGDATYTAIFTETLRKYTITWKNADGTTLETDLNVPYGTIPTFDGAEPTKDATAQYTYTFDGWDKEVVAVVSDATYTAVYSSTVNTYTITWVNFDGSTLETDENVEFGETPSFDTKEPTKAADNTYTYGFAGWSPEVVDVTGDATYTATFTQTYIEYNVKFISDGNIISDVNYHYGDTVVVPSNPEKDPTVQYTYTFTGWTPEVVDVIGDATYTAIFTESLRKYTINFVNYDGTILQSSLVTYGTVPTYDGATPTKESTVQYTYTFDGWDNAIVAVSGDATYTALFTQALRKYTITFKAPNGDVLQSGLVDYGTMPLYEGVSAISIDIYMENVIIGWDSEISAVAGDANYIARVKKYSKVDCFLYEDIDDTTCRITNFGPLAAIGMEEIVIPVEYNGKTIVEIGNEALGGKNIGYQLREVTISSNVKTIGTWAFKSCNYITSLILEEGVERIENYAFYGCSSITELIIPSTLTYIGAFSFYGTSLDELFIPITVLTVESRAFDSSSIEFFYCEAESVPEGWSPQWKYNCFGIPIWGFTKDCKKTTIDGITYIIRGDEATAFNYSGNLTTIVIPDTVEIDLIEYPVTIIGPKLFYNNEDLIDVTIGNNVVEIGEQAFHSCTNLVNVYIPDSVETIGNSAFYLCRSIAEFNGMNNVKYISRYAFIGMDSLIYIYFPSTLEEIGNSATNCRSDGYVILAEPQTRPSSWSQAEYNIIFNCPKGTKPYLINNITYLITGENTVQVLRIRGTGDIVIPSTVEIEGHIYNVTSTYNYLLNSHNKGDVTSIEVTGSVGTIPEDFINTSLDGIITLTFNEGITTIEGGALFGLTVITDIYLPHSLEYLGDNFIFNSNDATVHYNGTKAEWDTLIANSSNGWNDNGVVKSVICTDQTIDLTI